MTTRKTVRNAIKNIIDLLVRDGLVRDSCAIIERGNGNRILLSCERSDTHRGVARLPYASVEEYLALLRTGRYSVILNDGSFLYLSYEFSKDELVGHSILYYPVPCDINAEDLEVYSLEECLEGVLPETSKIRLRSPIRFDYDPVRTADNHPAVHAHINTATCRIPVSHPVGPLDFVTFILSTFYADLWRESSFPRLRQTPLGKRTLPHPFSSIHLALH